MSVWNVETTNLKVSLVPCNEKGGLTRESSYS